MRGRSPAQGTPSAPQPGSQDSWAAKNAASLTALAQVEALLGSNFSTGLKDQPESGSAAGDKPDRLAGPRFEDGLEKAQRPLERQPTAPGVGAFPPTRLTRPAWASSPDSPNSSSREGSPLIRAGRSNAASSLRPNDNDQTAPSSDSGPGASPHKANAAAKGQKAGSRDLQSLLRKLNSSVASLRASVSNPTPGRRSGTTRIPVPRPLPVPIREADEEEEEVSEFEDDDDEEADDEPGPLLQARDQAGEQPDWTQDATNDTAESSQPGPAAILGSTLDPKFQALWDTDDDESASRQPAKKETGRSRSGVHKKSAESGTLNRKLLSLEAIWNNLSVAGFSFPSAKAEEDASNVAIEVEEPKTPEDASNKGKHKESAEQGTLNRKMRSLEEAWKELEALNCKDLCAPAVPALQAALPEPRVGTHSSPPSPKAQPAYSPFAMPDVQADEEPVPAPREEDGSVDLKEAVSIAPVASSSTHAEGGALPLTDSGSALEPAVGSKDLAPHNSAESIAAKPLASAAAEPNVQLPVSTAATKPEEDADTQPISTPQVRASALPSPPASALPRPAAGALESRIPGPLAAYRSLSALPKQEAPSLDSEQVTAALAMHPSLAPPPKEVVTNFRRKAAREQEELPKLEGPIELPLPAPQKMGSRLKFWKSAKAHLTAAKDISPPARVQRAASDTAPKQGSRRLSFPGRGRDASPERPVKSRDSFTKQLAGMFRRRSFSGGPARSQSVSPTHAPAEPAHPPSLAAAAAALAATPLQTSRTLPGAVGTSDLLLTGREPEQDSWVTPETAIKQLLVPNWVPSKLPIAPATPPTGSSAEGRETLRQIPSAGPSSASMDLCESEATGRGEEAPWVTPEAAVKNLLVPSWVPSKLPLQVCQPSVEDRAAELQSSAQPASKPKDLIAAVGSPRAAGLAAKPDRPDWSATSRVPISDVSLPASAALLSPGRTLPRQPSAIPEDSGAEQTEGSCHQASPLGEAADAPALQGNLCAPEAPSPATAFIEAQLKAMELPNPHLTVRPRKEKGFFKALFRRRSDAGGPSKNSASKMPEPATLTPPVDPKTGAAVRPAPEQLRPRRSFEAARVSEAARVEHSVPSLTLSGLPQRDDHQSQSTLSARSIDAKHDFSFQMPTGAIDTPSFAGQASLLSDRSGPSSFRRRVTDEDLFSMERKLDSLKANFDRIPQRTPSRERGRAMSTGRVRQPASAMFPSETPEARAGLRARPSLPAAEAESSTPAAAAPIRRKFPSPIAEEPKSLSPEKASPPTAGPPAPSPPATKGVPPASAPAASLPMAKAPPAVAVAQHPADAAATRSWMESLRTPERVRRAGARAPQAAVKNQGLPAAQPASEPKAQVAAAAVRQEAMRTPDPVRQQSQVAAPPAAEARPTEAEGRPSTSQRSTTPFGRVRCNVDRPVPYVKTPREPITSEAGQAESPTTALTNALKQTAGSRAEKVESPQWRAIAEHVTAKSAVEDAVAAGKLSVGMRPLSGRHQGDDLFRSSNESSPDRLFGEHGVAAGTVQRLRSWTEQVTNRPQQPSFTRKASDSGEKSWQSLRSPRPKGPEPLMVESSRPAFPALKAYLVARSPGRLPQQPSPDTDAELAACRGVASLQRRFETGLLESNVAALQRQFEQQGQPRERAAVWATEHAQTGTDRLQDKYPGKQRPAVIQLTASSEGAARPNLPSPGTSSHGSGVSPGRPGNGPTYAALIRLQH